jgi:hypothetical protein
MVWSASHLRFVVARPADRNGRRKSPSGVMANGELLDDERRESPGAAVEDDFPFWNVAASDGWQLLRPGGTSDRA